MIMVNMHIIHIQQVFLVLLAVTFQRPECLFSVCPFRSAVGH